jgi:transcriptional regulator with XRE-family HTH domain
MITIPPPGRAPSDPADIAARRAEFHRLRKRLGLSAAELGNLTGLSASTIRNYASRNPSGTATWTTIDIMHQASIRQADANIAHARHRLIEAEIERQELENRAA